jgi:uncharacterized protein (TIGR02246 family)
MDTDEAAVRALYASLLDAWNLGAAHAYASCFTEHGQVVGFDGSQMAGRTQIASELGAIFRDHKVATYVPIVRSVRAVGPDGAVLHANVGMVPPGATDVRPEVNAIQSLVAQRTGGEWKIAHFQNTPAAFHGRPELAEALTEELRAAWRASAK